MRRSPSARRSRGRSSTFDESVNDEDFDWAARVSVGLDRLVDDFELDSVAYYHRGLDGEIHERLGAGMILGRVAAHGPGHPHGRRVRGAHDRWRCSSATASTPVARSREFQALNFPTASSRWATTAPRTSR